MKAGCLYVVATPIGNLGDISYRAVEVLQQVTLIAAEDTRHSQRLLSHYSIKTKAISLHDHNEAQRCTSIIERLNQGKDIALISDAGTPLISDPGYHLVGAVLEAGLSVVPVPGACAAIAGLSVSGLATDRFSFIGFLPPKGAVRSKKMEALVKETQTLIFYESTHRIINFFELACEVFGGERQATVARELTKTFETVKKASLQEILDWIKENPQQCKGEFVVMLAGADEMDMQADEQEQRRVLTVLLQELSVKQAVALAVGITGAPRKQLYQLALSMKEK